MSNVPWTNLNPNAMQVVLLDPSTGQMYAAGSAAAFGTPADAAWDGVSAEPSVISLLKKIALNTAP